MMNSMLRDSFRLTLLLLLLIGIVLGPATAVAEEDSRLILGATVYYDSGRMEGEEQLATQIRDQSFEFRNANFLSARLLYLRPFSERLHIGGGFDFLGTYKATILEEDGPADPPERYEFGPLLEVLAMAEWRLELTEKLDLGLGGQLGLAALFPRGDFGEEVRDLQDDDVPVFSGPRPGWSAGGHAAAIWSLDDRLSLRADLGVQWQSLYLFATSRTIDGVAFRKSWSTGVLRTRAGLALEVTF